jgi:hypothetical protein
MNAARGVLSTVLVLLCALVGVFAFGGVAQAAVTHRYLSSPITEVPAKGPPPAEETVESPGPIQGISNMTEDSGNLYLARSTSESDFVDTFDASSGAFTAQFAPVPEPYFDFDQGLAVGHETGETEIYVGGDENGTETQGRVVVYDASGHIQGYWTGSDTPAGHFGCFGCNGAAGVAVDNSGNLLTKGLVYVVDPTNEVVDVFEAKTGGGEKYVTQITGPEPGVPFLALGQGSTTVAVDELNGDVLVTEGQTVVDVFEPAALGKYVLARRLTGTPAGPFEHTGGVTVDVTSGELYVWESQGKGGQGGVVDQFSSTGAYLGHLTGTSNTPSGAFGGVTAVALDQSGDVYVGGNKLDLRGNFASVQLFGPNVVIPDVTTEPASSVKPRSATLHGTVNPDEAGAVTCRFEWGTGTSFGHLAPCEPEAVANGNSPVAVHAALVGLQTDTTYHYRLVASNANGTNFGEAAQTQEFATPGPGIDHQSAAAVTSTSATLQAEIDPDGVDTTYYFQYGTSAGYGSAVPAPPGLDLASGKGDVAVSLHLQGLASGTTYHYRVVAVSEAGGEPVTVEGSDETLTTQPAGGGAIALPDGRQWEMVSPPNKLGSAILGSNGEGDDIQAAADGSGITYGATSPFVADPAGARSPEVEQMLSTRDAPGNWSTADLVTPHNEGSVPIQLGNVDEYKLFSTDLSLGVVEPQGATPLPPLAPSEEATVYLRTASGGYRAVVTSADLQAPGETLRSKAHGSEAYFVGASRDLSHILLISEAALAPGAPAGGELYELSGGRPQLVSVLPNRQPATRALLGEDGGFGSGDTRMAVSGDGERVVWEGESGHHYLRDLDRGETVAIDAAQGVTQPPSSNSAYQTASADDSRVFFTSPEHLTADSTAANAAGGLGDLYVFEVTSGKSEPLAGSLTDLTVAPDADETAGVRGVIGASEDGSDVYFVAAGVLGDGAEHGAGNGGDNLYVEHYDEAGKRWTSPHFIAALAEGDALSWGGRGGENLSYLTSRVSPDGEYLAFMSERSLTGYENRDASSGVPDEEVFLYDSGTGRLACASCNPTGARPQGVFRGGTYEERLWDFGGLWGERWVAGDIPGWTAATLGKSLYQARYLSNSGRLFFNSSDALVPSDVNGEEDVYEYEPTGVAGCGEASPGASVAATEGGCVGLISAGTSSEESAFMDASESGADVFFLTESRLSSQDYDNSLDLYDAHECTATSPCAPATSLAPPPCTTGDACKSGPTPQPTLFGAPSSETFSGAGNVAAVAPRPKATPRSTRNAQLLAKALKACGKKPKRRRAACKRLARERYGAKRSQAKRSLSGHQG